MKIVEYTKLYEDSWVRCRTLSFLYTQYYDDVIQNKPAVNGIELICLDGNMVVGLIDVEISEPYCSYNRDLKGAMLETIAIHPDYQKRGIGKQLLNAVEEKLRLLHVEYLEVWTREDKGSNQFYHKNGFEQFNKYYHVFISNGVKPDYSDIKPIFMYGHAISIDEFDKKNVDRIYECRGYVKKL
ncbi:GNAT family N-acetyltransferase [Macrococcus sp. DPC7161]|uniref:GNAT family N-acetyltransferase n=1 Tax=Macrococcus sp. DPC7161 TaxID=2507060 RepID=UPI0013E93BB4|nr:GNAT family N-acetyltransferase [Macrococcus sp. DPC7161]